jgi:hypothetical protein
MFGWYIYYFFHNESYFSSCIIFSYYLIVIIDIILSHINAKMAKGVDISDIIVSVSIRWYKGLEPIEIEYN